MFDYVSMQHNKYKDRGDRQEGNWMREERNQPAKLTKQTKVALLFREKRTNIKHNRSEEDRKMEDSMMKRKDRKRKR